MHYTTGVSTLALIERRDLFTTMRLRRALHTYVSKLHSCRDVDVGNNPGSHKTLASIVTTEVEVGDAQSYTWPEYNLRGLALIPNTIIILNIRPTETPRYHRITAMSNTLLICHEYWHYHAKPRATGDDRDPALFEFYSLLRRLV